MLESRALSPKRSRQSVHVTAIATAAKNRLLAALPGPERQHLLARCEQIELRLGDMLCQPGERMRHVYSPPTASSL